MKYLRSIKNIKKHIAKYYTRNKSTLNNICAYKHNTLCFCH